MFVTVLLTGDSHIGWCWLSTFVGGLGLGALPTVNTMVVQNAIPKRLLGAAMGALFFSLLIGVAVSPAILDSARNVTYKKSLSLPDGLDNLMDSETMVSLQNPDALLNPNSMSRLEEAFKNIEPEGDALLNKTVPALRNAFEASLRRVFLLGAITMFLAFLLILSIPEIPISNGADE